MSNEKDRVRKNARAVIEECRREQDAWFMREATVGLYDWAARQNVPITRWSCNFYRTKDDWQEAQKNTDPRPRKAKKPRVPSASNRLNRLDEETIKWLRGEDEKQ